MVIDPLILGIGSAIIALALTLGMPVSAHRVNQAFVSSIIAALVLVAAFSIFEFPISLAVAMFGIAVAIVYRDVMRWVREFMWHNVYRYTHRYYWYNRVGRAILGGGRRRGR